MPTFATPDPIHARIDVSAGLVRVRAGERSDTVVQVRPADPRSSADVQAAEETRVEYAAGTLVVTTPRKPRLLLFGTGASVEVDVSLPEGSRLDVSSAAGDVASEGRLGDVAVDTRYGDIRLDRRAGVGARTAAGDISVAAAEGRAEAGTSYGDVRVGSATGDLRLDSACGDITVDLALGSVDAGTKYGQVRVREAVGGTLRLQTAYGSVETGIREGTAAWLDVESASGKVRNFLTETGAPNGSQQTVRVHARTSYGDIVIRRA